MTIDDLERLEKAATPGPWEGKNFRVFNREMCSIVAWNGSNKQSRTQQAEDDIAIIAALRNAAPALLRVARAAAEYRRVERDLWHGTAGQLNAKNAADALDAALAELEKA